MDISDALTTARRFFFDAPLYKEFKDDPNCLIISDIYGVIDHPGYTNLQNTIKTVDGFCFECGRNATFHVENHNLLRQVKFVELKRRVSRDIIHLKCSRVPSHTVAFWLSINGRKIKKIGQSPSHADITNANFSDIRKIMDQEDSSEFYKAVGLAAHGIGAGSFVYLRRVFERVIQKRHNEIFPESSDQEKDAFKTKRMEEKIDYLQDYLPEYLVRQRQIYGILSKGIHSLSEEQCLFAFEILKQSIVLILQDMKSRRDEDKQRLAIEGAIQQLGSFLSTESAE